jgi:hypothetical protein
MPSGFLARIKAAFHVLFGEVTVVLALPESAEGFTTLQN